MKKSITVKRLKEMIDGFDDNLEIFVANSTTAEFDGLTSIAMGHSVEDDKEYVLLIALGDRLKI